MYDMNGRLFLLCLWRTEDLDDNTGQGDLVEQAAEMLYGLIHARFIMTNSGIARMVRPWAIFTHMYCVVVFAVICSWQPENSLWVIKISYWVAIDNDKLHSVQFLAQKNKRLQGIQDAQDHPPCAAV